MNSAQSSSSTPAARPLTAPIENVPPVRLGWIALALLLLICGAAVAGLVPRWRSRAALRIETRELSIPTVAIVTATAAKAGAALTLPAGGRPFLEAPLY